MESYETKKEIALKWIKKNIDRKDFEDDESSPEQMMDWYAHEMAIFCEGISANDMQEFIERHYTKETYFGDHEKVAEEYYDTRN